MSYNRPGHQAFDQRTPRKRLSIRTVIFGIGVVAVSFFAALLSMNFPWSNPIADRRPQLAEVPPLQPITRSSIMVAPAAIALSTIREAMEAVAPRNLVGKREGQGRDIPLIGDIGWTVDRGPLTVAGRPEALAISTPLNGTFRATGTIGGQVGGVVGGVLGGAISGLAGANLGRGVQDLAGKTFDQRVDVRGAVSVLSRPVITPAWRIVPNLSGAANIADVTIPIAAFRLSVSNEVKPFVDNSIRDQLAQLEARIRNDPFLEQAARREWARMCHAISLGSAGADMPQLWLEMRPTRAFAAQPRIDAQAVHLTIGVQAETRIVPNETKPNCPFPAQLEIVPQVDQGRLTIGVPIDIPFTEVNKLLEAQLAGRTFPENGSGPVDVTVRHATVEASGNRLLISLQVKVKEKKSWFGFGAEATLHIWGRPALDRENQILRLGDLEIDVDSEAAFGLLDAAARAAAPQLQAALAEKAVVDLKPFAADAKKRVDAGLSEFRKQQTGMRINATVTNLRLADIAFDAKTLRIIADANGSVDVAVRSLALP